MFPHRYFAFAYFPNPYFPESQGEIPPVSANTINSRRKGASRTHVIPT